MTQTDLLYRALKELRKLTLSHRETSQRRNAIAKADAEKDKLTVVRTRCEIEEDWILAIEEGLPFIEKAIGEERKFILTNGETVEIEKVKHVSKESVAHLARHSNYITRAQEGEDVVPDRLYTVERLNDYAVYENRFLYMLLCRLRDFVLVRYNKILELTNTYRGELAFDKVVNFNKEQLVCRMTLNEERKDDKYLIEHNPMKATIERIDVILRTVYYFLRTPLMSEVAKADKLKPPVTKTNVLRMDKNFKEVVKLYEFLLSYTRDGYSVVREERALAPLAETVADEFAETVALASFLAYSHGLGMEAELEEEYKREEARRKEAEEERLKERIKELRRRVAEGGTSPEEYMLLLEERNAALERDSEELLVRKREIAGLQGRVETLLQEIAEHNNEIERLNERHGKEIAELNAKAEEIGRARDEELRAHKIALREAEDGFYREMTVRDEANRAVVREKEREISECKAALEEAENARALSAGRLNALRFEHGLLSPQEDFTSEESFNELERQYAVFQAFFRGQWRKARRRIRREMWKATIEGILMQIRQKRSGTADGGREGDAPLADEEERGPEALPPEAEEPAREELAEEAQRADEAEQTAPAAEQETEQEAEQEAEHAAEADVRTESWGDDNGNE